MGAWKDTTSYSRDDRMRTPTCWSMTIRDCARITVLSSHLYYPGVWVVTCDPWFNAEPLAPQPSNAEEAQRMALQMVGKKVDQLKAVIDAELEILS